MASAGDTEGGVDDGHVEPAEVGGSLKFSYGPDPADIFRRSAAYVDRILRGEKPSELPVQPGKRARTRWPQWERQKPCGTASGPTPSAPRCKRLAIARKAVPIRAMPPTVGYLTAILLADMVPEKAAALYAREREFGDDRIILSIHFPSDVEAGRFAATAIANALLQDAAFLKQFSEAKMELRPALGL